MGSVEPQRLLSWTIFIYRKQGQEETEHHRYITDVNTPIIKPFLEKYGILRYTVIHNESSIVDPLLDKIVPDPNMRSSIADYDAVITMIVPDIENIKTMQSDPDFLRAFVPDHANFSDMGRCRSLLGWVEDHTFGGK